MHWKCRVNMCSVMVKKSISWFRSFAIHFPADTVMCKCNYVGLLVVLGAQIHSAKSPQFTYIKKGWRAFSTHFNKPVLPFLGMQKTDGTLLLGCLTWFLCLTFKPMSHCHRQSSPLNGILSLFPTSLEGPGTTWFSCSSLNRWDMKCGTNLTDVQTVLQIALDYPNKIPNMLTTSQILKSVFYDKFFHSIYIFNVVY